MAYADFKSYIQDHYSGLLTAEITKYVEQNHDANGFHSINVLSLCDQKVDNVQVQTMLCREDIDAYILMEIHCSADIVMMGLGKSEYEASRKKGWFTVRMRALLRDGLHDVTPLGVEEYSPGKFKIEGALDEYLIPYISTDMLEEVADDFTYFFCDEAIYHEGMRIPVESILAKLGIEYYDAPLPDNVFGRMYFQEAEVDVIEYTPYMMQIYTHKKEKRIVKRKIKPGTMLISDTKLFMDDVGSFWNTIAHEIIHWLLHQKFFEILKLLNVDEKSMSCLVQPNMTPENLNGIEKAVWWAEWQANMLAPKCIMPREIFIEMFYKVYEECNERPRFQEGEVLEETLEKLSKLFCVSRYSAKARAIQLGLDTAEGVFLYIDHEYFSPISFPQGTLRKNQTFVVDKKSAEKIISENESIRTLIEDGLIVYTGCVFCINDEKYVRKTNDKRHEYELTQYGGDHVDECCLIFDREFIRSEEGEEVALYSTLYLSREVSASPYVEAHYNPKFKHNQSIEEIAKELEIKRKEKEKLDKIKKNIYQMSFSDTFKYHRERKKISYKMLADRTDLSETILKCYANGSKSPTIENMMAIFIGLNLHPDFCYDLLQKEGKQLVENGPNAYRDDIYRTLISDHTDGNLELWNLILKAAKLDPIPKKIKN